MRRGWSALGGIALALLAATGRAQVEIGVSSRGEPVLDGQLDSVQGTRQPGGYGYVVMTLRNVDSASRSVSVRMQCRRYGWQATDFSCRRHLALEPGEWARLVVPLPTGAGPSAQFEINTSGADRVWTHRVSTASENQGPSVMYLGDTTLRGAAWQQLFDDISKRHAPAPSRGGARTTHLGAWHIRQANGLPDRWQWLTGFDAIVVDGAARDLDGTAQRLLREYAAGGGSLLVLSPDLITPGPLKEALADTGSTLGRVLALDENEPNRDADRALDTWLQPLVARAFDPTGSAVAGPVPQALHTQLSIRGLGEVPVRLFFVFILVFAVVVGPISHFVAYRRRQPMLMLFTVPTLGIGCTLLFLAVGLFSEGFGIQGAISSYTVLDQREHRSVSVSTRTLYAGLSPAALRPRAETYLYSPQPPIRTSSSANPFDLDLDSGRIGGSLLPSRNPTSFVAVSQGPCRDRLRFRRRENGDLEILAGPNLQPTLVYLRDHDERLYHSEADGRMVPVSLSTLRDELGQLLSQQLGAQSILHVQPTLEPGTYFALMQDVAAVDDFGLTVDYLDAAHVVKGLLAAEDIVE